LPRPSEKLAPAERMLAPVERMLAGIERKTCPSLEIRIK
jgi:hypothetical protein